MNESNELAVPSMYAQYLREREGVGVVETSRSMAIYVINNEECYIRDIFVLPEFRNKHESYKIADLVAEIGRKSNCKILTGSVVPTMANSNKSIKMLMGYGMKLHSSRENLIFFSKDL